MEILIIAGIIASFIVIGVIINSLIDKSINNANNEKYKAAEFLKFLKERKNDCSYIPRIY